MITSVTLSCLIILNVIIALKTISKRGELKIAYGHNENKYLKAYTAAHHNFSIYVPLMIMALYIIETLIVIPLAFTATLGLFIIISRSLHAYALMAKELQERPDFTMRKRSMQMTLTILLIEAIICITLPIKIYFF